MPEPKTKYLQLRISPAEQEQVRQGARARGRNASDYLRAIIWGIEEPLDPKLTPRFAPPDPKGVMG